MVLFHISLTSSFFVFGPPLTAPSADWLRFDLISLTVLYTFSIGAVANGARRRVAVESPVATA
jgi:hypothetical protein